MRKENGRLKPADKEELADIRGKKMECPSCGNIEVVKNAEFASETCSKCGSHLRDANYDQAKLTGRVTG